MKKLGLILAGAFVVGTLLVSVSVSPVYAAKEALWEEAFDSMEEGEETGLIFAGALDVDMQVQAKVVNGAKGKALKVSPKEGLDYSTNYNMFGVKKDMSYPNENAVISFSYFASGISGLNVMTNNRVIPENCEAKITGLIQGKWTKVVLRVSKFKVKSPKGTIKTGDEFRYISIFANINSAAPLKDQYFVLDDIKLTIGEDEAKGDEKKK